MSLYRLLARARAPIIREWAAKRLPAEINMNVDRQILDANWRLHMKRAIGQVTGTKQNGGVAVDFLGDIRKAFETLVRELLWHYAIKEGYPLDLLYMALSAYTWTRYLVIGGFTSRGIIPHRGIAAGSTSATYELALYMLGVTHRLASENIPVTLSIHVDDTSLSCIARDFGEAVEWMVQAILAVHDELVNVRKLAWALDKTQITASSAALARFILDKVKHLTGGEVQDQVRRLEITSSQNPKAG